MGNVTGYQSEKELEERLVNHLVKGEGYERVYLNEDTLLSNFKVQIEKHNREEILQFHDDGKLSPGEFERLTNKIIGKTVHESALILRSNQPIESDNGKGKIRIELFNSLDWCKNEFQVSNQITEKGIYNNNRYDVTLLINGLPLVQIELKRRGVEFRQAFNQIVRYSKESYRGLFSFVQFFVISNGTETRYFANNPEGLKFDFAFRWTNDVNEPIENLEDFATYFLPRCNVAKMIARYMVIGTTDKSIIIMRPYQVFAVEKLSYLALETSNGGYVWHTTGSGKTLTSFKCAKLLSTSLKVNKVFFLVDRKDLDDQTIRNFNKFEEGCVSDDIKSSNILLDKIKGKDTIILSTIQKMSNLCKNPDNWPLFNTLQDKKVIFINDECHRSHFGTMHAMIKKCFPKAQYFGFTGTPIFEENKGATDKTTEEVFGKCIHKYLIKNAIADNNVLAFSVDYVKTINTTSDIDDDKKVASIDTPKALMAPERIKNVVDYIFKIHNQKTINKKYNAIFAVSNIDMLAKYYREFKKHNDSLISDELKLKVGAIFTVGENDDGEAKEIRPVDEMDMIVKDFNGMFGTDYSAREKDRYFKAISKATRENSIDILLVVNMFLTGFDAPTVNTLYVDKSLKWQNLLQAFSRTNRIESNTKQYGNIVCFQTNKKSVEDSIKLFSNSKSDETVIIKPYSYYIESAKSASKELLEKFPTVESTDAGGDEEKQKEFVQIFRNIVRSIFILKTFSEFEFTKDNVGLEEQQYEDYKGKYLYFARRKPRDKGADINKDIDFEVDLLENVKYNVHKILLMLQSIVDSNASRAQKDKQIKDILQLVKDSTEGNLFLKSELIETFVNNILPHIENKEEIDVETEFEQFMDEEREKAIDKLASEYGVSKETMKGWITDYSFSQMFNDDKIKSALSTDALDKYKQAHNSAEKYFSLRRKLANMIKDSIVDILDKYNS